MRSIKYFVYNCLECNNPVLVKVDFQEFENECCLELKNLKPIKVFNDEQEAKNYLKLIKKDEE